MDQAVPLLGTQQEGWSTAAELAHLQRKVADLAAELEVSAVPFHYLHCAISLCKNILTVMSCQGVRQP